MATDDPTDDNPNPPPADGGDTAPAWARELKQSLDELPAKLRATVTDEDKSSIAETVHGLFEKSGAFHAEESKDEPDDNPPDDNGSDDKKPDNEHRSGMRGFAARHFGGNK